MMRRCLAKLDSVLVRSRRLRGFCALFIAFVFSLPSLTSAAPPPRADPSSVAMSARQLARMDDAIEQEIAKGHLPGAVVLVARAGHVVWRKAYGARAIEPRQEAMTPNTVFDLASLTKVVATATSIMILLERGKLQLTDPVSLYIPELTGAEKERITIEQLLTHTAGYAPDFDLKEQWTAYDEAIARLIKEPLRSAPGSRFVYSDIGYIALGEVVHRASGMMLDEFTRKNIFGPLGMRDTDFRPAARLVERIAPTEKRSNQSRRLGDAAANLDFAGKQWLRGEVHDPTSNRMGGVAGHAGLFSSVDDLSIYCQMILNGGRYRGVRVLSQATVAMMSRPRLVSPAGWSRGLGWDINTSYSTNRGDLFPLGSFGHTGFTGTSLWIDKSAQMFVIFLSNRVHPNGKGDVGSLRGRVSSIAAGSVTDSAAVARRRKEFSEYHSQLVSNMAAFAPLNRGRSAETNLAPNQSNAQVLTGIDVLERDGFKHLAGLRVGLVTNQTGRNRDGRPTIDVLNNASALKLIALFSPEHGIRGIENRAVSDSRDVDTGLPIYSLFGETRRPKPEQFRDLDAIVFDVQDVGARFYTYISTLGYVMEEAAKAHLPVFVLDRPNPIGGLLVGGPLADADRLSFTSYHTLPVRHGMTLGELAGLFNQERKIGCDLHVIRMEGWKRSMWFDATGLHWTNPSPNMRSLTQASLYPGIGLLETTNVSVGRGTDTPFEVVGAPWIRGINLAQYLNRRGMPGVRFVPVTFNPQASIFRGETCDGINIIITNRADFDPVQVGIEIGVALRALYPSQWSVDDYARLLVNADTLKRLKRGENAAEIMGSWMASLREFWEIRNHYLLYK